MLSHQLRKNFIEFFEKKGHKAFPSSNVSPQGDPTLLFTNAGMNQFKPFFLGDTKASNKRAVSCQKCVRVGGKHNDLENVGHTPRHLTFFEMLGNFSFGDYFKQEAIDFAWQCTQEVFGFDPSRVFVSVFKTDDEAFDLWKRYVPEKRIACMGEADNYWSMGATGPCGPCSELYYDMHPQSSHPSTPAQDPDGKRFLEFWNLVFMQDNKMEDGKLLALPSKNIDTGAGLERLVALKMGVENIFEIDTLSQIVDTVHAKLPGATSRSQQSLTASRVIADHLRMLCFAISDGVLPSNTDQGYILRKVIRRAARYGRQLGHPKPFLASHVQTIVEVMKDGYDLKKDQSRIEEILDKEEESFLKTLARGGRLLTDTCESAIKQNRPISGAEAFKLKDTYGMPFEEIVLLAKDNGLQVDEREFASLELKAKEISRSGVQTKSELHSYQRELLGSCESTIFSGYTELESSSKVLAICHDQKIVPHIHIKETPVEVELAVDRSPLYVEQGGQISDTGQLLDRKGGRHVGRVLSSRKIEQDGKSILLYKAQLHSIDLMAGDSLYIQVDAQRRSEITVHHSATHLLHHALRQRLGNHVVQKGSLVSDTGLRFDFSHHKALSSDDLRWIESFLMQLVTTAAPVQTEEMSYESVRGDTSITQAFGDRYGETVRVVTMGPSKELCGGTHVKNIGEVGPILLCKESSISAGVRRIEAVAGTRALAIYHDLQQQRQDLASSLKTSEEKIHHRVEELLQELTAVKKEREKLALKEVDSLIDSAVANSITIVSGLYAGTCLIFLDTTMDPKSLSKVINHVKSRKQVKENPSLIAILNSFDGNARIVLQNCGSEVDAGQLIQHVAPLIDGRGGGRKDQAQAGGTKVQNLALVKDQIVQYLQNQD